MVIVPAVSQCPTTAGVAAIGTTLGDGGADPDTVGDGGVDAPQDATMIAIAATQANLARIVVLPGTPEMGSGSCPLGGLRPASARRSRSARVH